MTGIPEVIPQRFEEHVPLDRLVEHPANPNEGDLGLLSELLDANGFAGAVMAQESTGIVMDGNHRLKTARQRGMTGLPVIWADVDDDARDRILASFNESTRRGRNDESKLVALLTGLAQQPRGLEGTGFDGDDLDALIAAMGGTGGGGGQEQNPADSEFAVFPLEQVAEAAFEHFRRTGFPYRALSVAECMHAINRLAQTPDESLMQTDTGYHVADTFHPRRFSVECTDANGGRFKTPVEAFELDNLLKRAIGLVLDTGGKVTGTMLVAKLSLVSGTRAAANFRPGFALSMYRRFCPPGGTVLDTSMGFGGRLVGFLASEGGLYIGIDPLTHDGNGAMVAALGVTGRVEIHAQPAEDVKHELLAGRCDFAFTSPPYFGKERYADEPTQSWKRYQTGEAWRAGFLEPMMRLQFSALKDGAVAAVNIADVTMSGQVCPLEEWTVKAGEEAGFRYLGREAFPLGQMMGQGDSLDEERAEPVFMFRKDDP